jgi:hypothetical protein
VSLPSTGVVKKFTKNLDLRGQPAGGGLRSGNGRFNDAVYRVGAWRAVPNICAASGDFARPFRMYGLRARSGYNDLVDHAHECGWRDVLAIGIFGRRLAQISDLCRTA